MSLGVNSFDVAKAVAPADATDLPNGKCAALWIGAAGDVVIDNNGATITVAVPKGLFPVACTRVRSTLTTATGIFALY
jgi:hypothetical protein